MSLKTVLVRMIPPPLRPFWDRIEKSPLGYRLIRGAFWSLMAAFIGQGLTMMASVVAARILGQEQYGELNMIQSTVAMFGVFAGWALGLTATRYIADFRGEEPDRAGRVIALSSLAAWIISTVLTIILFFIAGWIASEVINAPHLELQLRIGCLLLLFNAVNGAQNGILAGFEAFKTMTWSNSLRGLISFPLIVAGVYWYGVTGAVVGMVVAAFAGLIINHIYIQIILKQHNVTVRYDGLKSEIPLLWSFSLPAVISGAMIGPVIWGAKAILTHTENGYIQLGIFTAAFQIETILQFINTRVGAVLLPMLSSKEGRSHFMFNRSNMLISWAFGVLVGLPIIAFPELMGWIFGDKFSDWESQLTLLIVMCYASIIFYKSGLSRVLVANSLMWWGLSSNLMWAIVLLGCTFWLADYGAKGLAMSFLLAYAINTVVYMPLYYFKKLVPGELLISLEAFLIWLSVGGLAAMAYYRIFWGWRLGAVIVALLIVLFSIYRLLFHYSAPPNGPVETPDLSEISPNP